MSKSRESGAVVKIDSSLLSKIDEIIKKEDTRQCFLSNSQTINPSKLTAVDLLHADGGVVLEYDWDNWAIAAPWLLLQTLFCCLKFWKCTCCPLSCSLSDGWLCRHYRWCCCSKSRCMKRYADCHYGGQCWWECVLFVGGADCAVAADASTS